LSGVRRAPFLGSLFTLDNERPVEAASPAIRIVVIVGSIRRGNFTSKAAALVVDELQQLPDVTVEVLDPGTMRLSLPGQATDSGDRETLVRLVGEATGVVFATPEYHGSYSSVAKLIVENLGFPSALAGKPVALLGVASGTIGAVKALEHLRSVCSHVGAIVLPGPVSVAKIRTVFGEDGRCRDEAVEQRVRRLGRHLVDYIRKSVCPAISLEAAARESGDA